MPHDNRRVRHELRFRTVHVVRTEALTPHMRRIVVAGDALAGFFSPSPDDHVKLFFPNAAGEIALPAMTEAGLRFAEGVPPSPSRDYTPRHFDAGRNELALDFVMHGDGIASRWAAAARPGDVLGVGGPRGSHLVAGDYAHHVLVGDETALPAIARWCEEHGGHVGIDTFVEIAEAGDRQPLPDDDGVQVHWLERNGVDAASSTLLEDALRDFDFDLPTDTTFWWIACESRRARAMRLYLEQRLGVPRESIRATGYWKADPDAPDADD